jgi:hypothetical protein
MSDLRRLIDEEGVTDAERSLLRAGATDEPEDARARDRALTLALGAAAPVGAGGVTGVAKLSIHGAWKGVAILVIGGAVSVGVLRATKPLAESSTGAIDLTRMVSASGVLSAAAPSATVDPVVQTAAPMAVGPTSASLTVSPPVGVVVAAPAVSTPSRVTAPPAAHEDAILGAWPVFSAPPTPAPFEAPALGGSASSGSVERGPRMSGEPPVAAPSSPLMRETAQLDDARSALTRGEARRALNVLDTYARTFPRGVLRPEAEVLRIEALLAAGDRPGAQARADALTRGDPDGPYARRVRRLLSR